MLTIVQRFKGMLVCFIPIGISPDVVNLKKIIPERNILTKQVPRNRWTTPGLSPF